MEHLDLTRHTPMIIVAVGAFISFLIVMYYVVKEFAIVSAKYEIAKNKVVEYVPYKTYTIHFRNGTTYKFGGVNLIIKYDEEDPNEVISFKYGYDEDVDELSETEYLTKYSQQLRFIDYSEILYIEQRTDSRRV